MALRIKELCKQKGMTMVAIADRLHITPVTLSQSLSGNPTLSRLTEVADILGVNVGDLFERNDNGTPSIKGCVFVNDTAYVVDSKEDIENVLKTL